VYMPTFERLPPRFRDSRTAMVSRDLRRLVPIPPSAPFVAPFRIQPTPYPRIRLNVIDHLDPSFLTFDRENRERNIHHLRAAVTFPPSSSIGCRRV